MHAVTHLHASWSIDGAVDAEGKGLVMAVAPVEGKGSERVEVRDPAVRVVRTADGSAVAEKSDGSGLGLTALALYFLLAGS